MKHEKEKNITNANSTNVDYYDPNSMFLVEKMHYGKNREMDTFHFHNCYELFFLLEGERTYVVESTTLTLYSHNLLCLAPSIFHRSVGTSAYTRYVIYFDDTFIAKYYTSLIYPIIQEIMNAQRISFDESDYHRILIILESLEKLQLMKDEFMVFTQFTALLGILYKNIGHFVETDSTSKNQMISDILQFINDHYQELDTIDLIADFFHLSKYYLCHLFKVNTGMTIIQYLTTVKMKHSCELLIRTKLSVTEISERCGFHTSMYFNNVFKREMKMTPREYRKRYAMDVNI